MNSTPDDGDDVDETKNDLSTNELWTHFPFFILFNLGLFSMKSLQNFCSRNVRFICP